MAGTLRLTVTEVENGPWHEYVPLRTGWFPMVSTSMLVSRSVHAGKTW